MDAVSWGLLLLICILSAYYYFWHYCKNDNYWKERGVNYQPKVSIITLCLKLLQKPLYEFELENYKKCGKIYGFFEGNKPNLTVAEPELLRDILVKDFQFFSARRVMDFRDPLINKIIFALNGDDWKRVRTIMTPTFTSKKMRKMSHIMRECADTARQNFLQASKAGKSADCKRIFGAYAMDVVASAAFATRIDSHNDPNNPFVIHARNAFTKNAILRTLIFFLIPEFLQKIFSIRFLDGEAMDFFRDVTLQVIEERKKKGQKGNDFLQLMIDATTGELEAENKIDGFKTLDLDDEKIDYGHEENNDQVFKLVYHNKNLSTDELLAQCVLFFTVGYETTGSTLSFTAYNLACNPDCQERLIEEVDKAFEEKKEMDYDTVRDMKYMNAVVCETLRMYPPLIRAERTAVDDYRLGDTGIVIPKGMIVGFPIYAMHHDPELFPNPEKFDPERFMTDGIPSHHPYAYLPFGAGPRNCLGMRFALLEIKMGLAYLLRYLRFRVSPETKKPLEFGFSQGFLSPKNVMLQIERRDIHGLKEDARSS